MHQVFINDKPLIFKNVYQSDGAFGNNYLILSEAEFTIMQVFDVLKLENTPGIVYLSSSPDQTWNQFVSMYTIVEAAGGIVQNFKNEFLVIYRMDRWDLPKGKLDYNETPEDAACREIKEECGLNDVELKKPITTTFHTYTEKNKNILKKTHWFALSTKDDAPLIPQREEKIEKAEWMTLEKINEIVLTDTYESIKEVFQMYLQTSDK